MELNIEYLPVEALRPYDRNARKHAKKDIDAIAASIREFGFDDPIGIWGDGLIVEGHGRLLAAKQLGMTSVPCIRLDHLTDEQRRAYTLAHNRTAELSGWDFDMQAAELGTIENIDMTLFGFDPLEAEVHEDDYNPQPPEVPMAKLGDIYQLGRHRLMCGDSTSADDVAALMGGVKADMLLTDPPYNVALGVGMTPEEAKKRRRRMDGLVIQNDQMSDDDFLSFLEQAFRSAKLVMRGGAAFHIWHASSKAYPFFGALHECGMPVRQVLIWVKPSPVLGRQDFQWQHEPCLAGDVPPEETEDPEAALYGWTDGTHTWKKRRKEKTILYFDKPQHSKEHPTMKPVLLFDYEMQCNTVPGDNVLDIFGGSGTTIIAAEQNGRNAFLMELDPKFVDVIIDRWEKFTGETAVKLN